MKKVNPITARVRAKFSQLTKPTKEYTIGDINQSSEPAIAPSGHIGMVPTKAIPSAAKQIGLASPPKTSKKSKAPKAPPKSEGEGKATPDKKIKATKKVSKTAQKSSASGGSSRSSRYSSRKTIKAKAKGKVKGKVKTKKEKAESKEEELTSMAKNYKKGYYGAGESKKKKKK
tara:strand:+ start:64 stop:582 length:519 start_codon:yes stop_codon:yes gene_type:complete